MLTKFNDMNEVVSDAIHSCIKDGYKIDAKESVIDHEEDNDCVFKAVLKKDVDGIECKTVITLNDNEDDKSKYCTYHKVETVGDTKWSEETHTYSSINTSNKLNDYIDRLWNSKLPDVFDGIKDFRDSVWGSKGNKQENTKCNRDGKACSTKLSEDSNKPDDKVCKPVISKVQYDSKLNREKKVRRWKCTSPFHKATHCDGEDLNKNPNSEDNKDNTNTNKSYINDYISMISKLFGIA